MRLMGRTHGFPNFPEPWASLAIAGMALAGVTGAALIVAALASVIGSDGPVPVKIGWSAFVIAVPPVGILLWFLVGRRIYT